MEKKIIFTLMFGTALLLTAGCGQKLPEPTVPLVKYETVRLGPDVEGSTYAAAVRGRYETVLAFQVGGRIASRTVQLGDRVRAGEVLMTLDPKDVAQTARQSAAQVEAARANLALARSNLARYTALYQADAVAAMVLEQQQTAYDAAAASYENALAQDVQAQNALSYTNLTANADGLIAAISAEVGQVVSAGMPVMTLVQTEELEVEMSVPENRRQEVAVGRRAEVSFWALGDSRTPGVVREISPMADSASRTYAVRVALPEPPAGIMPGMTASVYLSAERAADTATLPLSALYQTGDTPYVWIIDDEDRLRLQAVTVEGTAGNRVILRGLAAGDRVVTAGVHKLHEGESVRLGTEGARP